MSSELESERSDRLTDEEIRRNIPTVALAGMDTTAGTLQYAMMLLALHPEAQEWLIAGESSNPAEWDFESAYPRLVALMCTIVSYPPPPHLLPTASGNSVCVHVC